MSVPTPTWHAEAVALAKAGISRSDIQRRFSRSAEQVRQVLRRGGLEIQRYSVAERSQRREMRRQRALELRAEGLTEAQIADALGINRTSAHALLHSDNEPDVPRATKAALGIVPSSDVARLHARGVPLTQIAALTRRPYREIIRIIEC